MTHYPKWFLPALLALLAGVLASGLGLVPATLVVRAGWDVPWRPAGDERVWLAALHCAGGFALAAFLGALWSVHMRSGWRRGRQRVSGALLGFALTGLAATAIAIYYVGDDRVAALAAYAHLAAAALATAVFGWHLARGRATGARDRAAPARPRAPRQPK